KRLRLAVARVLAPVAVLLVWSGFLPGNRGELGLVATARESVGRPGWLPQRSYLLADDEGQHRWSGAAGSPAGMSARHAAPVRGGPLLGTIIHSPGRASRQRHALLRPRVRGQLR